MSNILKKTGFFGKSETSLLRSSVYFITFGLIGICLILIPELAREQSIQNSSADTYPFIFGAYLLFMPVFYALYQVYNAAGFLEKDQAISNNLVSILRHIKFSALSFGVLIILESAVIIYFVRASNPVEDVTHIFALGFLFTFASSVIATITALFQRLLQKAVDLKNENELTV